MMEIKFRAWDAEEKNFIYFDALDGILSKCDETYRQRCVGKFEQFTGLHDKKNREIYHGDICKIKFDVEKVEDYVFATLSKKEIESGERIFLVESPLFNNQPELNCDDIEVIGNIHENPELLEGRE